MFLVKWKYYSAFDCTWEPKNHLSQALLRHYYFDSPRPSKELVQEHVNILRSSIITTLKGKAVLQNMTINFRHDVFKHLFRRKGRELSYGKWIVFDSNDFANCKLPKEWSGIFDQHGDGSKAHFPIKMRYFLAKTPKSHYCNHTGDIKECNPMYIEKISMRFVPAKCIS